MNVLRKTLYTICIHIACLSAFCQVNTDGVKIIAEDERKALLGSDLNDPLKNNSVNRPSPCAILDVYSTTRGVMFPSVTYNDMLRIIDPADGLTVFVNNGTPDENMGFWLFHQGTGWVKLSEEVKLSDESASRISLPDGGVIMYYGKNTDFDNSGKGKIGTALEGWAICNGNNGTPDLRSMFTVMALDPGITPVQSDKITYRGDLKTYGEPVKDGSRLGMTEKNLPRHTHGMEDLKINITHTHGVTETAHTHRYYNTDDGTRDKVNGLFLRRGADDQIDLYTEYSLVPVTKEDISEQIHEVNFVIDKDLFKAAPQTPATIENRPAYKVLYYIMKVNYDKNEGQNCFQDYNMRKELK